ncbi:Non-motile and phage-resistance protein [mine drainage metagenome]|uniref:histidine kinase n=1 Tax=mine drainage metagenome TaxID=410659 RepID=A0A1J5SCS3_9ZZZZ
MSPSLRVLFVEDSDIDAQLVLHQLAHAGYSVNPRRVETEEELRAALVGTDWDLILCDYQLPRFSAPEALRIVREHGLDVPFIVVSGSISADLAVDMMRRGAHDYLIKGDMARFVPAVERELRETATRRAHREAEAARSQAEEARRASEARYREVFQITSDLILCFEIGPGGEPRLRQWNTTAARLLGIEVGPDGDARMPASFSSELAVALKDCAARNTLRSRDLPLTPPGAADAHHFHTTFHPIAEHDGQVSRVFVVGRDVTERKRGEEALRRAHDDLERRVLERTAELTAANARLRELDRLKSEFLATMSHELRTPLNAIIGFTGLVKDEIPGPLNPEQKRQLAMAYSSSKHLLGLINDLLDVSRIEAGGFRLNREAFDFAGVVAEAVGQVRPLAEARRLTLCTEMPPGALPMFGDRRRCLQILINLAHNAVKFTEQGGVDIAVRAAAEEIRIDVTDTGVGIAPAQVSQLFEAFRQFDTSSRRNREGTGLGLYLCRKLLNLMGGDISVESTLGRGSRFSVRLPRNAPTDGPAATTRALPPTP